MENGLSAKADHDPLLRRSRVTGTAAETLACSAGDTDSEGGLQRIEVPSGMVIVDAGMWVTREYSI
jgi:hypothetical protein